jgi:2'-5' RNA ligase
MDLQHQYDRMRQLACRQLVRGEVELDPLLALAVPDERRGLTLRARPPALLTAPIQELLAEFQRLEPEQYYYPGPEVHITILAIISAYPGFTLQMIDPSAYREAVRQSLARSGPFTLTYSGVTASPGAILLQGFPQDEMLWHLREQLRTCFQQSRLSHSIDARYPLQTAHSTLVRFRSPLRNPARVIEWIQARKQAFIGSFLVDTLELVYNDWYHRTPNTVLLEAYSLGGQPGTSQSS